MSLRRKLLDADGMGRNADAREAFRGASRRRIRGVGRFTAEAAAEAWLTQARRLLAAMDWPADLADALALADGVHVTVEAPSNHASETAGAIADWALEASNRVLRGEPQPADAEVYKAARELLR